MITAVSAIANGGLLYRPHVVLALRKGVGKIRPPSPSPGAWCESPPRPPCAACSRAWCCDGTGKLAQLDGYTTAGKTGTAQKIDPATGRYSATQLIASFVGFAPINNPAVTILVQLDSPRGRARGRRGGRSGFQAHCRAGRWPIATCRTTFRCPAKRCGPRRASKVMPPRGRRRFQSRADGFARQQWLR